MCCDEKSHSFWRQICPATAVRKQLLVPVLRLHLVFQNIFLSENIQNNFLSFVRKQSRWQTIISPSHLKHSGLFSGTAVCWMCRIAFEVTQSVELCHVSLWKMTSLGFLSFLFRQDVLSESGWDCPWFCCLCWKSLWLDSDPALHKLHVRNCRVSMPRVISSVRNIVLGVAPILSICWYCIVLGLLSEYRWTLGWGFLWAHGGGR